MKRALDDCFVKDGCQAFQKLVSAARPTFELCIESDLRTDRLVEEISRITSPLIRAEIVGMLARTRKIPTDVIRSEIMKRLPSKNKEDASGEVFTADELEKGLEMLKKSSNILENMLTLTNKCGYVGEEENRRFLYLSFTSRKLNKSISGIVKAESAAGKNALIDAVRRLFPKEDIYVYSYITANALFYFPGDLSHKILYINEHVGGQSADYAIRITISEDEISIALPTKDESTGNFTLCEKRIKAVGLVHITTTTREKVHHENQTRVFDIYLDESQEQTKKILDVQSSRQDEELEPELEAEIRIWQAAQTLLEKQKIHIPYAQQLVPLFPTTKVRVRRDYLRFLALIKAHALLYQYQRMKDDKGRLVATLDDLKGIAAIAGKVLEETLKELTPKQEKILNVIQDKFSEKEFSLREVYEEAKNIISNRTLQRYLELLSKDGILEWNGQKAKDSRYSLSISGDVMTSTGTFQAKLQKLLEYLTKNSRQPDLTSSGVNVANKPIDDIDGMPRQNPLSSINSNNENELNQKKDIHDMTTREKKEERDPPGDSQSELAFALNELPRDPNNYSIETIPYSNGGILYRVEVDEGDRGLSSYIVEKGNPLYEKVHREYERRTR